MADETPVGPTGEGSVDASALAGELLPFLKANPSACLEYEEGRAAIANPWGDPTLKIQLGEARGQLVQSLNSVVLPERFSAIWHRETEALEFVWAVVPASLPEWGREFEFQFAGRTVRCRFSGSSRTLLEIARAALPADAASHTNYRNLLFLRGWLRAIEHESGERLRHEVAPCSFWVSRLPLDEEWLVGMARHLNLCMYRFDRQTPRIIVHEPQPPEQQPSPRARFPLGPFPSSLRSRQLDPRLLELWESAAGAADPVRRFLYHYQVIEYAAFYLVEAEVVQAVGKALLSPDLPARAPEVARRVVDLVAADRRRDEAKIVAAVERCVDPEIVWREMEPCLEYFSRETRFDGGFVVSPLLKPSWGLDDFKTAWAPKLPDTLRAIRNALVHSREPRMAGVIAPTRANLARLGPWMGPLSAVSTEIVLFADV